MASKKIAVILSGCGVYDGSEIHESTLTLLAIDKNDAQYQCFAPNINQHHVINHITGEEITESRNVLIESARIARGNIKPLSDLIAEEYDALVIPGGFGAAKNLSDYAFKGDQLQLIEELSQKIGTFHKAQKPIVALCIAPVLIAKTIKNTNLTIGADQNTSNDIISLGAQHSSTSHGEIIIDKENKIITSPCYMLDARISQIEEGINNAIVQLFKMI